MLHHACWMLGRDKTKRELPSIVMMRNEVGIWQSGKPICMLTTVEPHSVMPAAGSLSSNRDPRTFGVHSCCNVHGRQFLKEQFRRVRNVHLRNPRLVLARPALERIPLQVSGQMSAHPHPRLSPPGQTGTYAIGVISPQMSQMCTRNASDTSNSRSFRKALAPWEIMQSRSISPNRSPPSRARPSTG